MAIRDYKNSPRTRGGGATAAPQGEKGTASKGGKGKGLVMGVLIGLAGGVIAAISLAMYLNRQGSPFAERVKPPVSAVTPAAGEPPAALEPNPQKIKAPELPPPVDVPAAVPDAPAPSEPAAEPPKPIAPPSGKAVTIPSAVTPMPAAKAVPAAPLSAPVVTPVVPPAPVKAAPVKPPPPTTAAEKHAQAAKPNYDFYKILPSNVAPEQKEPKPEKPPKTDSPKQVYLQVGAFAHEMEADNLKARLALLGVDAKIQSTTTEKGLLHRVRIGPLGRSEDVDRLRAQLKAEGMNPTPVKAD